MPLEIDYDSEPHQDVCECCGGRTTHLTRFVTRDDDAYAVVYLRYAEDHSDEGVKAAISVGPWWDGTSPADRTAFALELRSEGVMVQDAETSPWMGVDILGPMLDREPALQHAELEEVYHITDHLFLEDPELRAHLGLNPEG